MATYSESKTRNQDFLQKLERQRLSKSCKRIIDLRGKVVGECQAYTFGGLTHYLDDRGYLLVKQLLDRANGHYTIGVYEALFKALKLLSSSDTIPVNTKQEARPILVCDAAEVQMIAFDNLLLRKEPRIDYATPVEMRIDDVLYNAATIDITSSAIRVALKRAFALDNGDKVIVSFPEFISESRSPLLEKVNYTLLKVEHDEQRSYAILIRDRNDNEAITIWFDQWSQAHNTLENRDIDDELLNLTNHYYLRLFSTTLNSPLFWLSDDASEQNLVKAFNLSPLTAATLTPLQTTANTIDFSLLPFQAILEHQCDYLIVVYLQDYTAKSIITPRTDSQGVTAALAWHQQHEQSHVLLMQSHSLSIDLDDFEQEIRDLAETDNDYAQTLKQRLATISSLATLTELTPSCLHLPVNKTADMSALVDDSNRVFWSGKMPKPSPLCHHIDRKSQRFFIKTDVVLKLRDQTFAITTNDVSETGLSLSLSDHVNVKPGAQVRVNFVRWQSQTKKTRLDAVPFIIKNIQFWEGTTILGMERHIPGCSDNVNAFFASAIERNKERLTENTLDVPISQETKIFSSLLGQKLTSIPFYLCMDNDNKRILQAVASSQNNHANKLSGFWLGMQGMVPSMSSLLKALVLSGQSDSSVSFGLYGYQDQTGNWQLTTDHSFTSASQKSLFISRALLSKHYHFFLCTLMPIKPSLIEQQGDLNQKLSQLRSHSPHKIKQIKDVLNSLFAVGELTDISDIITSAY